jgi:hypothetical protein
MTRRAPDMARATPPVAYVSHGSEYRPYSRALSIMPDYRITVRYGGAPPRYEIVDLPAEELRAALRAAADRLSAEVAASADLAEVRVQAAPDSREYTEG